MARRLRLALRLLKPDGVLIVTIDVNELHHLAMLLEELFPDYLRYMVSIVINPAGVFEYNFARIEEQALFCCPNNKRNAVHGAPIDFMPASSDIEMEIIEPAETDLGPEQLLFDLKGDEKGDRQQEQEYEYNLIRRRGTESRREDRPLMFYPIYIDEAQKRVVRAGQPIPLEEQPSFEPVDGLRPVWPINAKGMEGRWQVGASTMQQLIDSGDIVLGTYNRKHDS
jgi:adenine-specific DNA-methyltransferase